MKNSFYFIENSDSLNLPYRLSPIPMPCLAELWWRRILWNEIEKAFIINILLNLVSWEVT